MAEMISMQKRHDLLYQLLCAFRDICEAEGIWYSLGYGTALGAVRHQGFIPWDRDADVLIRLPDKDRVRAAFIKHKPAGMVLKNHEEAPRCLQSHDTMLFANDAYSDVSLDIYPLVGAPSDEKEQARFAFYSRYVDKVVRSKYSDLSQVLKKNRPIVCCAKVIDAFIPDSVLKKNIRKRETRYDYESSEFLITLTNPGKSTSCIPKDVWEEMIPCDFNGSQFAIPSKWDVYLSRIYGDDYMTPNEKWVS